MPERNFAFIDGQNLYKNIQLQGWRIDYAKFKEYLKDEHTVTKAYIFLGYVPQNTQLYNYLEELGYSVIFKKTTREKSRGTRGNCDADLAFRLALEFWNFDKAILVSGDGDYTTVVEILSLLNKLRTVLAPNHDSCSDQYTYLLEKNKLLFLDDLKNKISFY